MHWFLLLVALLFTPAAATSHLAGGEDRIVGDYLIDFGFEPVTLSTSERSTLVFNLVNATSQEPIPFATAWVRISDSSEAVFAGTFASENGNVPITFTFPRGGEYEITVTFGNGSQEITRTSFPIAVKNVAVPQTLLLLGGVLGGLGLAFIVVLAARMRAHNSTKTPSPSTST
jgi:hypothetical protein